MHGASWQHGAPSLASATVADKAGVDTIDQIIATAAGLVGKRLQYSESVDLIYLDPPFNSNKNYEAPIGSQAAGAAFKDTWTLNDLDEAWHGELAEQEPALHGIIDAAGLAHGKSMMSYLIMMGVRLLEMRRILKDTGSIYLHCDLTAGHYLKMEMDAVFGDSRFRSEIIWKRTSAHSDTKQGRRQHGRIHDVLLYYTTGDSWTWNPIYTDYDSDYVRTFYRYEEEGTGRLYRRDNLTGPDVGGCKKDLDPPERHPL